MKYRICEGALVLASFMFESDRDVCCTYLMEMYPERVFRSTTLREDRL